MVCSRKKKNGLIVRLQEISRVGLRLSPSLLQYSGRQIKSRHTTHTPPRPATRHTHHKGVGVGAVTTDSNSDSTALDVCSVCRCVEIFVNVSGKLSDCLCFEFASCTGVCFRHSGLVEATSLTFKVFVCIPI